MENETKVLLFLKDNDGARLRSQVCTQVFNNHITTQELDNLLNTVLSGLVTIRKRKNRETWKLTPAGWSVANQMSAPDVAPAQTEAIPEGFARFKTLAKENPDASPQRLLQLAGRSLGDPLSWPEWRETHPEWYLQQPRDWYSPDVQLDESGYPLRIPADPLTAKERETRPTNERGWFDRAMRQPGASLEPLACEMPAYECANVLRVTKKVGQQAAEEIFGLEKIMAARRLVVIHTVNSSGQKDDRITCFRPQRRGS